MNEWEFQNAESSAHDAERETPRDASPLEMFSRCRPLLFSIAYRMLGSAADAEDMVQETFIRWQQSTREDIRSPRAFMVTVISRLCIQYLESARVRREEYVGQWLPEPVFTDHWGDAARGPEMHESLSMAFLLLLEKLSPAERAAFLLHEVFGYEYGEISSILGKSEVNCRQLVRRARRHITTERPRFHTSQEEHKRLLEGFLAATSSGDLEALIALLSNEVVLYSDGGGRARAALRPVHGRDRVAPFLLLAVKKTVPIDVIARIEQVNGRPSILYAFPDGRVGCVVTFDTADEMVRNIYIVTNPEKLTRLTRARC